MVHRKKVGEKYGRLTIIEKLPSVVKSGQTRSLFKCRCDCGKIVDVTGDTLGRSVNSCGCLQEESRKKIIPEGTRFGRLRVKGIDRLEKGRGYYYKCECDCGNFTVVRGDALRDGTTSSCGCYHDELFREHKPNYSEMFVEGTHIGKIKSNKVAQNSTSGVKGVTWHSRIGKWQARIQFKGKMYHLGYFDNIDKAAKVRKRAEKELYEDFLKWYKTEYPKLRGKEQKKNGIKPE